MLTDEKLARFLYFLDASVSSFFYVKKTAMMIKERIYDGNRTIDGLLFTHMIRMDAPEVELGGKAVRVAASNPG